MDALREIVNVRQFPGEPKRRWFSSDDIDLIVWLDDSGAPVSFQLCYDKLLSEHALTWKPESGFVHLAVDGGEQRGRFQYKSTPILVADEHFDANRVTSRFTEVSAQLPTVIVKFVTERLRQHPNYVHRA
jgi:hypothetical protein